ncbi:hypothetical protein ABZ131_21015 [Providencia rettgeri]
MNVLKEVLAKLNINSSYDITEDMAVEILNTSVFNAIAVYSTASVIVNTFNIENNKYTLIDTGSVKTICRII